MGDDEAVPVWFIVVCTNPECAVYDTEFRVPVYENADGSFRVVCGRCGKVPQMTRDENQEPEGATA